MAIFHCDVKVISRSKSATTVTAKAAYRSGEKIYDPTIDETYDYTRKRNIFGNEILAPKNAPEWVYDRAELWVAIERKEDASTRRDTAQLARELILALPVELEHVQRQSLVRDYVQTHFVARGMIADIAYHDFGKHNPHAHVLLTMREITPEGFGKKERSWNKRELVKQWREEWANHANRHLEREGHSARIDHRSLKDRGIDREPQIHLGPVVIEMEQRGIRTEMGDTYRAIAIANDNRRQAALQQPEPASDKRDPATDTTQQPVSQQQDLMSEDSLTGTRRKSKERERKGSAPTPEDTGLVDERALIYQWQQYQEQGPERSKPQDSSHWQEAKSWGIDAVTLTVLRTYTGLQAKQERERRIDAAIAFSGDDQVERSAFATYLSTLGRRLREKGRGYYKLADRWLAERLARRGYSQMQTKRILAEASPELMDHQPGQRVSYLRQLVDRVYHRHEQQQRLAANRQVATQKQPRQLPSSTHLPEAPLALKNTWPNPTSQKQTKGQDNPKIDKLRQKFIKRAFLALDSKDFEGYQGTAIREYRKELARKINVHGQTMTDGQLGIETDRDIAIRLYGAGFSKLDIRQAIIQASPQLAGKDAKGQERYCSQHIDSALAHPKVKQAQQEMWDWRRGKGLRYERRLDRLGLATEGQEQEQDRGRDIGMF
ncbi:MAG: MobQ family relaxase [Cyanobacteria bacterium J06638_22]